MLHLWGVYDILTRCNKAVRYIIMAVLIAIEIYLFCSYGTIQTAGLCSSQKRRQICQI